MTPASWQPTCEILYPGEDDYEVATFDWAAKKGSGAASNCRWNDGYPMDEFGDYPGSVPQTGVTSVQTNTGGTSLFNGCWLRLEIELPSDYAAPRPNSEASRDRGWLVEDRLQHEWRSLKLLH